VAVIYEWATFFCVILVTLLFFFSDLVVSHGAENTLLFQVASTKDRIHLKTTHHAYAKHLEQCGDVAAALHHFKEADTHRVEVPRLLFERKRLGDLEQYVLREGLQVRCKR